MRFLKLIINSNFFFYDIYSVMTSVHPSIISHLLLGVVKWHRSQDTHIITHTLLRPRDTQTDMEITEQNPEPFGYGTH